MGICVVNVPWYIKISSQHTSRTMKAGRLVQSLYFTIHLPDSDNASLNDDQHACIQHVFSIFTSVETKIWICVSTSFSCQDQSCNLAKCLKDCTVEQSVFELFQKLSIFFRNYQISFYFQLYLGCFFPLT